MAGQTSPISDHDAIRNVLGRYSIAVDHRDFDGVAKCFTEDAVASYSGLTIPPGRENVVDHIRGIGNTKWSTHYLHPILIEVDGDEAYTVSYGMAVLIQDKEGQSHSVARGLRYRDNWRRTADGWQISNRLHTADWTWDLPVLVDPGGMWKVKPDVAGESIYRTLRQADAE